MARNNVIDFVTDDPYEQTILYHDFWTIDIYNFGKVYLALVFLS